jgi:hypothetical protein
MGCNQIGLHFELHPLECRSRFQNKSKKVHFLLCIELEYFFLSHKAKNIFPEFNFGLYDKNSESGFFSPQQK